jgi:hypothetical protein
VKKTINAAATRTTMPTRMAMRKRSCFIQYLPRPLHCMGYGIKRQAGGHLRISVCDLGLGPAALFDDRQPALVRIRRPCGGC